jgi:hypothetical protein
MINRGALGNNDLVWTLTLIMQSLQSTEGQVDLFGVSIRRPIQIFVGSK